VLAGNTAGLERHRILDICIQAVAHGQDILEYRKLKKRSAGQGFQMSGEAGNLHIRFDERDVETEAW